MGQTTKAMTAAQFKQTRQGYVDALIELASEMPELLDLYGLRTNNIVDESLHLMTQVSR